MRTVVGVLRGGPSSEYDISLLSGAHVLGAFDTDHYDTRDIFIDKQGKWHSKGVEVQPERALQGIDVAFNVLHGEYGENGDVQRILEAVGTPYTGSDAFASTLAFNKHTTREIVTRAGIKVPSGIVVEQDGDVERLALDMFRTFPHPAIVKPVVGGSSVGMTHADSYHALHDGLHLAFAHSPKVLVEEFIKGKEATVGVIEDFRDEPLYALMPVEIVPPPTHSFFTYEAKSSGESIERVPGNFSAEEKKQLMELAKQAHSVMGAGHYSRSDFIVSKRGIYFLEINSAAAVGMTKESLFPKAIAAVGSSMKDFLHHVVQLALRGRA